MSDQLHVFREGAGLGAWSEEDAAELLRTGFLNPADRVRVNGDGPELELGAILRAAPDPGRPPASQDTDTLWDRSFRIAGAALGGIAGRVGPQLRRLGTGTTELSVGSRRLLEGAMPWITAQARRLAHSGPMREARAVLDNEAFLRRLFGALYDLLPRPVSRFIPEAAFVEFCLKNRDGVLGKQPGPPATDGPLENPS